MSVTNLNHLEWTNFLCRNLMSLRKKAALCDTRLRLSDSDSDLLAHGCVLTAASPVLMSQLQRDKDNDHLCLPSDLNYPCHVWLCLLQFIYSGSVTLTSTSQAAEVLEAAETLELQMLVYLCEFYMQHVGIATEVATKTSHSNWLSESSTDLNKIEPVLDKKIMTSDVVPRGHKHRDAETCPNSVISKCSSRNCSKSAERIESSEILLTYHDKTLTLQNKVKFKEIIEQEKGNLLPNDPCMDTRSCDESDLMIGQSEVNGGLDRTGVQSQQSIDINLMAVAEAGKCLEVSEPISQPSSMSCEPSASAGGGQSLATTQRPQETSDLDRTVKPPLTCPHCGKFFAHRSILLIHLRKHTGEKPFVCYICGHAFTQSGALKGHHQRAHTNDKPYQCVKCGKTFAQKSDVQAHQRVHSNVRPHMCPDCGKTFARHTDLACHQRSHLVDKMFTCGTCGRGFSQRCALRCHERVHTGERPYPCVTCDKAFSSARALKKHMCKHDTVHCTTALPVSSHPHSVMSATDTQHAA